MAINTVVSGGPVDIVTSQTQFLGPDVLVANAEGKLAFFGATPIVEQTVAAVASDAATTLALANSIRTILLAYGLVK